MAPRRPDQHYGTTADAHACGGPVALTRSLSLADAFLSAHAYRAAFRSSLTLATLPTADPTADAGNAGNAPDRLNRPRRPTDALAFRGPTWLTCGSIGTESAGTAPGDRSSSLTLPNRPPTLADAPADADALPVPWLDLGRAALPVPYLQRDRRRWHAHAFLSLARAALARADAPDPTRPPTADAGTCRAGIAPDADALTRSRPALTMPRHVARAALARAGAPRWPRSTAAQGSAHEQLSLFTITDPITHPKGLENESLR